MKKGGFYEEKEAHCCIYSPTSPPVAHHRTCYFRRLRLRVPLISLHSERNCPWLDWTKIVPTSFVLAVLAGEEEDLSLHQQAAHCCCLLGKYLNRQRARSWSPAAGDFGRRIDHGTAQWYRPAHCHDFLRHFDHRRHYFRPRLDGYHRRVAREGPLHAPCSSLPDLGQGQIQRLDRDPRRNGTQLRRREEAIVHWGAPETRSK